MKLTINFLGRITEMMNFFWSKTELTSFLDNAL